MKFFLSVIAVFVLVPSMVRADVLSQRSGYLPVITVPSLPSGATSEWTEAVKRCYQQANVRRTKYGMDVQPLFSSLQGVSFAGLPPANANFKCHVDGRGTKP